jgi:hypothetical protein
MKKLHIGTIVVAMAGAIALSACETASHGAGTGSGNVRGTSKPVAFTWQGDDRDSGDITATFASGRVFKGSYFQVTHDTRVDRLDPLWDGWGRPYRSDNWRYWSNDPGPEFMHAYSGQVLANMHAENGEYMRCRFTLANPSRGMAGGGEGRCQLSESGKEINADFPSQS